MPASGPQATRAEAGALKREREACAVGVALNR